MGRGTDGNRRRRVRRCGHGVNSRPGLVAIRGQPAGGGGHKADFPLEIGDLGDGEGVCGLWVQEQDLATF